jgi:hypothetical protein
MTYLTQVGSAMNRTTTEKGAPTLRTSNNPLVDFFGLAGATRGNPGLGLDLFLKAFAFDRLSAVRILFYLRDIRGGQGERQLFRNCLAYLAENEKEVSNKIVNFVPEYGRFDDYFGLQIETFLPILVKQLEEDKLADRPSLLAKWMPSENTSSKATRILAKGMMTALNMTPKKYRQMLSQLRKKISLVEQKMSAREFGAIDYSKVPSQASLKYRKAFGRNDTKRYTQYLESVDKGEAKINTSTLFPHQVYLAVGTQGAEQLWSNLPDYTMGKNAIVVADVSGSMSGEPMAVSVSLALYFAERNVGQFKDHFITFSDNPILQKINGTTLRDKMNSIERAEWAMNTNLYRVFQLLVDTATRGQSNPAEMPETIYIISDMEFDSACGNMTNFEAIDALYAGTDYKRPSLVFWNVNARNKQVPVEQNQVGVTLVSGMSPSTFRLAVENKSPIELVNEVIHSDRYAPIVLD